MGRRPVVLAVLGSEGIARELADQLAEELPGELGERFPGVDWRIEPGDLEPADPEADSRELIDAVRRRLLEEDWDLAVALTDIPLRVDRRPVSAQASAADGIGLVSIPALGAVELDRRVREAVVHLVEGLLGERAGRDGAKGDGDARMGRRLQELASHLGEAHVRDDNTVRFAGEVVRGNLRLLVGMVRANQPSRMIMRLTGSLLGALGTAAFSLTTSDVWRIADNMTWWRLLGLAVVSVLGTCLALLLVHGLWERSAGSEARERIMLFNLATSITLGIGVLTLYAGLFVLGTAGAVALIPPGAMRQALHHPARPDDYLRLAWLAATLATVGGALGTLVDSDHAVREAAYRSRADERTESAAEAGQQRP